MNDRPYGFLIKMGLILMLISSPISAATAVAGNLTVKPQSIDIWSFFSGAQLHVSDKIPAGSQAVLTIRGKRIDEEMMRKSRHWDLWMNSGEVDIHEAPILYYAMSSDPALLRDEGIDYPWGYAAIEKKIKFTGQLKPVEDDTIFQEFIQLKERDKLYHLYPGDLQLSDSGHQTFQVQADFLVPSRIKPGKYHVTLWILQDGKPLEKRTASFNAKLQGLPALLQAMAKKHDLLYGLLAVVVAVTFGMLTGILFKHKGKGH